MNKIPDDTYIIIRSKEEYNEAIDYLDTLGFVWGNKRKLPLKDYDAWRRLQYDDKVFALSIYKTEKSVYVMCFGALYTSFKDFHEAVK